MTPLLAAMLTVLAYSGMNMLFKRHAGNGGSAVQLTAWLGMLAPLWLLLLGLGVPAHLLVIPAEWQYWVLTFVWAALLPGATLLMVWLLQSLSLIELTAARKALVTLLAVGVDFLLLNAPLKTPALLAILVISGAALALPGVKKRGQNVLPLLDRAAWLCGLALLLTVQLFAYKKALGYQPDLASHIIIAKAIAALLCLPLVLFVRGGKAPSLALALGVIGCYFVGSVAEGLALRGLPLSVLVAATTATAALMAAHDLWRKDLPRKFETYALLGLILVGFVLMALAG